MWDVHVLIYRLARMLIRQGSRATTPLRIHAHFHWPLTAPGPIVAGDQPHDAARRATYHEDIVDHSERNGGDLIARYHKPVSVVEYSDFKREVNDIVFNLPNGMGKGTAIWEPLGWMSGLFDREGKVTDRIAVYDELNANYIQASNR